MVKFCSVVCSLCLLLVLLGADWSHWRGPHFNGSTDETDLPSKWSRTHNIAWSVNLPGAAAATPIVVANRVFVSSTNAANNTLQAMCFERQTGAMLWNKTVAEEIRRESYSNYASPSPVADTKVVIFFYGNGQLVGFDHAGNELWSRNVQNDYGEFSFGWSFSTSPLIYDGRLYLQVLQRDVPVDGRGFEDRKNKSYLLAMDINTGETLWQVERRSDARLESREAFSTPIPYHHDGRTEILVVGGDDLSGHDPSNGKERWRWGTWNPDRITHWRLVPSPVAGAGVILACAPKKDPIYAVRAGGQGKLDDTALAWVSQETKELTSDVPTPAFYDGDFFVLSDVRKSLARVDPQTGDVKWKIRTPGVKKFEASPLAADGKIYLINFVADVVVVDAADGTILNNVSMADPEDDPVRSSVVAAHGNLLIRTNQQLFCVGKH